jgi:cyclophilin family peptidyl-prolyl cis-trans isomerase
MTAGTFMRRVLLLGIAGVLAAVGEGRAAGADSGPRVRLETSLGKIEMVLHRQAAPRTVENFLAYAAAGFYDGTIFHRVVPGFVIQGGGLAPDMTTRPTTRPPLRNEAGNGLRNRRGTVAMARTGDPHSATSQFFINLKDNPALDFRSESTQGWGYCVFGEVVEGMEVVDAVARQNTVHRAGFDDVPAQPVVIRRVTLVE